jgi:hypothetical protein
MSRKATDQLTQFDIHQLLLFEEGMARYTSIFGHKSARRRAAEEIPQVFDSATLQRAVLNQDPLLGSYLTVELSWVARRGDWPSRRKMFVKSARNGHRTEANRRLSGA